MSDISDIRVFVDGSVVGRNQRGAKNGGGIGYVATNKGVRMFSGTQSYLNVTNNQMELVAILHALDWVNKYTSTQRVTIISDSRYALGCADTWRLGWKCNNYKDWTVKNLDIILAIHELIDTVGPHRLSFRWVKGHSGDQWNEEAHSLAQDASESAKVDGKELSIETTIRPTQLSLDRPGENQ